MTVLELRGPDPHKGTEGGLSRAVDAEGWRTFHARDGAVENDRGIRILHIPRELEGSLQSARQRTTNTRPFPKKYHVVKNGVFSQSARKPPVPGRLIFYSS